MFSKRLVLGLSLTCSAYAFSDPLEILIRKKPGIMDASVEAKSYRGSVETLGFGVDRIRFASEQDRDLFLKEQGVNIDTAEYDMPVSIPKTFDLKIFEPEEIDALAARYKEQWGMESAKNFDIDADKAANYTRGSKDVVVAVIDTGVQYDHPDLLGAMWKNKNEIPGNGIDDDKNGFVDDYDGWNFVNKTPYPIDGNGHGTHCAGVISAQGLQVSGVAPGVKIMPLKFLSDAGGGSTGDAIAAINYATKMGADIMSNSWGSGSRSQLLEEAIQEAGRKGVIFVAAAGNRGTNADISPDYPGAYNYANLISVAALREKGELATFSNYSQNLIFIAAPGENILSTYSGDRYAFLSGTSMATPFVSGAVALMISLQPDLSFQRIKAILKSSAKPIPALSSKTIVPGTLNAGAALAMISSGEEPTNPPTPTPVPVPNPTPKPTPTPNPPHEDPIFDIDAVKVEKTATKKWYQVYHRVEVSLQAEKEIMDQIKAVTYTFVRTTTPASSTSVDAKTGFEVNFQTKDPEQEIAIKIQLRDGSVYEIK